MGTAGLSQTFFCDTGTAGGPVWLPFTARCSPNLTHAPHCARPSARACACRHSEQLRTKCKGMTPLHPHTLNPLHPHTPHLPSLLPRRYSEQSRTKCIGMTIETRPDFCLTPHLAQMLSYGCTRLEIGLQVGEDGSGGW